jgi:hypothetical protein
VTGPDEEGQPWQIVKWAKRISTRLPNLTLRCNRNEPISISRDLVER